MGQPAAKQGDQVTAQDVHILMVPVGPIEVPLPFLHTFAGVINNKNDLSSNVNIMGMPAATVDSTATNTPDHVPVVTTGHFLNLPANTAKIRDGSKTVNINGKPAARSGDPADTCNDPGELPVGLVVAVGSVLIG
jgi:uncharacterized Zn-binding protein involved in type VI secretion